MRVDNRYQTTTSEDELYVCCSTVICRLHRSVKFLYLPVKKLFHYRQWRPIGLPTLSRQSAQMMVRLSAPRTRRTLLARNIIIFMSLVLRGLVWPVGLGKFKNHLWLRVSYLLIVTSYKYSVNSITNTNSLSKH
jgi:hypothetical protein